MTTRNLAQPFGAYLQREAPKEDEELTHVGPGTPGGEYLRRFWHPIAFSDELGDLPKRLRILSEDLVVFRDKSGSVGLVQPHCPHRGASLEFGIIEQHGIRCCYHGWLIDVDGQILETPAEPAQSTIKSRLCHGAYPTREYKGLVFAYMGPPEKMPALPILDICETPGMRLIPSGWTPGRKYIWPLNWVQLKENAMDPIHTCYLHTIASGSQFTPEFGILPELDYYETPIGMAYAASRRVGNNVWVRMHDLVMPNIHLVASVFEDGKQPKDFGAPYLVHWAVPIDDTHIMEIGWLIENEEMQYDQATIDKLHFGMLDDRPYEERQRHPGDYDAQVSQGPIAIHAREHLGTSDRGVVMFRRMLRAGIHAVQRGEDPPKGIHPDGAVVRTYTQNAVIAAPPAATADADRALLRSCSQQVFAGDYRGAVKVTVES